MTRLALAALVLVGWLLARRWPVFVVSLRTPWFDGNGRWQQKPDVTYRIWTYDIGPLRVHIGREAKPAELEEGGWSR